MINVMLDSNIFGRPYDDLSQKRILEEAIDCFHIFMMSAAKFINVKSSDVLVAELSLIKNNTKKRLILNLVDKICTDKVKVKNEIIKLADEIYDVLNDYMDSMHIAFAAVGNCDYFVTCDDEIIDNRIKITNILKNKKYNLEIKLPFEFVKEMENYYGYAN